MVSSKIGIPIGRKAIGQPGIEPLLTKRIDNHGPNQSKQVENEEANDKIEGERSPKASTLFRRRLEWAIWFY